MPATETTIEVVRGRLDEERSDQILGFWSREGVLEGDAAHRRLSEVVCLALDGAGEIAGVNSVAPHELPLVGGRRFWIYRSFLGDSEELWAGMFNAAFDVMQEEFAATRSGPIGLCVIVGDRTEMERRPEVVWPDTELMFAGYLEDDTQVRIRYFEDALIGPEPPGRERTEAWEEEIRLDERYGIEPLAETDAVSHDDVIALWQREGVVRPAEAQRRVHEVLMVVIEESQDLVGVSSVYLQRNPQLRMDLWYCRVFVASGHRGTKLSFALAIRSREWLKQRFVSGEDVRGAGVLFEVQYEGFKTHYPEAFWPPTEFTFIGENKRGDHVRVHYFPGARVPLPRLGAEEAGSPTSPSAGGQLEHG